MENISMKEANVNENVSDIQQNDENEESKTEQYFEEPIEKHNKTKTLSYQFTNNILNNLVDVEENEIITAQMKAAVMTTSLQNDLLLLDYKYESSQQEKHDLLIEQKQLEQEVEKQMMLLEQQRTEMKNLTDIVEIFKEDYSTLENCYKTCSNEIVELIDQKEEHCHQKSKIIEECNAKESLLQDKLKTINDIKCENGQLHFDVDKYQEKISELDFKLKEIEENLKLEKDKFTEENNKHFEILEKEEMKNEELKQSIKSLCLDEIIIQNEEMEKQMIEDLKIEDNTINEIKNSLQEISNKELYLEEQLNRIIDDASAFSTKIAKKEVEICDLQQKIKECELDISSTSEMRSKVLKELTEEKENIEINLKQINMEIDEDLEIQQKSIEKIQSDNEKLAEVQNKSKEQENQKKNLLHSINIDKIQLETIKETQKQIREQLEQNTEILKIMEEDKGEADVNYEKLKKEIEAEKEKIVKMKEEYEEKISSFKNEFLRFDHEYEKIQKEREKNLIIFKKKQQDELERIKTEIEIMEKKNEVAKMKNKNKRVEVSDLKKTKRDNEELRDLKKEKNEKPHKRSIKEDSKIPSGILKKPRGKSPRKTVTFSTKPTQVRTITSDEGCSSQEAEVKKTEELKITSSERLFYMLKQSADKIEDDTERKDKPSTYLNISSDE